MTMCLYVYPSPIYRFIEVNCVSMHVCAYLSTQRTLLIAQETLLSELYTLRSNAGVSKQRLEALEAEARRKEVCAPVVQLWLCMCV